MRSGDLNILAVSTSRGLFGIVVDRVSGYEPRSQLTSVVILLSTTEPERGGTCARCRRQAAPEEPVSW